MYFNLDRDVSDYKEIRVFFIHTAHKVVDERIHHTVGVAQDMWSKHNDGDPVRWDFLKGCRDSIN